MTTTIDGTNITFGNGEVQAKKVPYFISRTQFSSLPYTITGIPTSSSPTFPNKVYVAVSFSMSGTDTMRFNLGHSGGVYNGTNHWGMVGETAASSYGGTVFNGTTYIQLTRSGSANYLFNGVIEISKFNQNNVYEVRWSLGSTSGTYRTAFGNASVISTGVLDRISFSASGTNTTGFAAWLWAH